jgi:hypothetical protein
MTANQPVTTNAVIAPAVILTFSLNVYGWLQVKCHRFETQASIPLGGSGADEHAIGGGCCPRRQVKSLEVARPVKPAGFSSAYGYGGLLALRVLR